MNSAKNTINILFKNVMDLSVGVLLFLIIGFGLMYPGGDYEGKWFGFGGAFVARDAVDGHEVLREEDGVLWLKSRWAPPLSDAPGTDTEALLEGWVSLVPLHLDQTALHALPALERLQLHSEETEVLTAGANLVLWVIPTGLVVLVVVVLVLQRRSRAAGL